MIDPDRSDLPEAEVYEELLELLADRLQAGERLDAASLAREYPQYARRLEGLLPVMQAMQAIREAEGDAALPSADEGESLLGHGLAGCRVLRLLGRGGNSLVFEAMHPRRGRVALKVLSAAATRNPRQVEAFWHAAHVARRLCAARIVPAFEVGECDGRCYAVLKLIPGASLALRIAEQWMRAAHLDRVEPLAAAACEAKGWLRRVGEWMIGAADAVHAAHQQGVLHGDLKPANMLLDPRERLWVTDFAGGADAGQPLAAPLATLRYLSPERLMGDGAASAAGDVYALGATLYELIALEPAFAAFSPQRLRESILRDEPASLREYDASVSPELDRLVLSCLAKSPAARPSSAQVLAEALRSVFQSGDSKLTHKIDASLAPALLRPWGGISGNPAL